MLLVATSATLYAAPKKHLHVDRARPCGKISDTAPEFYAACSKNKKGVPHVMKLDRIDIKILYELQKNGRITNVELAELVNLSPSPCLMRVKKLQAEGYIEGYSAQININKLGQTLTVFTEITLKNHRQIDFARFLGVVEKIDQVVECHLVSGGYDYLLKFVTSGIVEYQSIMERLTDMDVGIDKYFSFVVLKSPIIKSHMPLTSLFPL
ncbi:AsnC family transcriptional regulator [Agrobacterium tumefaciens]|jgi:DNA-binding Lrp family transcriptional regulator|nr:AsnC family transcriptional regulator [Agrobacterium tumefaciens]SPZ46680.1 Leucine-responsive regulatory protein [Agrobacterium tumefaciens]